MNKTIKPEIVMDMNDYDDVQTFIYYIKLLIKVLNQVTGNPVNKITLDDFDNKLKYVFIFPEFKKEYLEMLKQIYLNKNNPIFNHLSRRMNMDTVPFTDTYFDDTLKLMVYSTDNKDDGLPF